METFEVGLSTFGIILLSQAYWGQGEGVALLGCVDLLKLVWSCWRKCVTVGGGFEVFYAQDTAQCVS